ncbi:hypothetical protein [Varunaivibrio sulfuroxidans]|uniref:Uncharacterized protein n=1 Tax=Varunaivibrio sulfuroxidans TaxID=1773489 RepID=A0A4R3J6R9_9PROT|nr:hypothetical protein [Varunaivibrio sulfuroxidans]TCS60563.1 hypothetical protein EDD55_11037 [Varunaivibrio sulfuroxidans]WES30053.1 hypothetical protein P3M64_10445 [Varunaivibrio sulfuroxidans]
MEKAIIVSDPAQIDALEGYDRVYYGTEFCDRLIPSKRDVSQAIEHCRARGLKFTLATPYIEQSDFQKVENIVELVAHAGNESEVVINDLGLLRHINAQREKGTSAYRDLTLLLGRLMNKLPRDPRYINVVDQLNERQREGISSNHLSYIGDFWRAQGIARFEIDNVMHPIDLPAENAYSLYYPYFYISCSKTCLTAQCTRDHDIREKTEKCQTECATYGFQLNHPSLPGPMYYLGNTFYGYNDKIDEKVTGALFSRLVEYRPDMRLQGSN